MASLEGRWQGAAATAFEADIWHPLSQGLGVLERECHGAASQLTQLAVEAEQAHVRKVEAINQEMQDQLHLMAATWVVASPEVGGAISRAVGSLAARLGGELVARIVAGVVDAIEQLLSRVLAAFARLFEWVARFVNVPIRDMPLVVGRIFGIGDKREGGGAAALDNATAARAGDSIDDAGTATAARAAAAARGYASRLRSTAAGGRVPTAACDNCVAWLPGARP